MSLVEKEFEKHLALYGLDIDQWPEDIRAKARQIQKQFGIEGLVDDYRHLDTLLKARQFEPSYPFLAERVIFNAQRSRRKIPLSIIAWLGGLFADFMLPYPVYAVIVMLALGAGIGFNTAEINEDISPTLQQLSFADEGAGE